MSGVGGASIARALRDLDRQARIELGVLQEEFVAVAKELQMEIVSEVNSKTNVPRGQIKRRVRVYKSRKGKANMYVVIRLGETASLLHTGRVKGLRQRKGKISSIPGVPLEGKAFLMRPKKWRGQKRRVYQRTADGVKSVNHPTEIVEIFDEKQTRIPSLLAKAYRRARMRGPRSAAFSYSRRIFGEIQS